MNYSTYPNCPAIPAQAGIHHLLLRFRPPVMDTRRRGGDENNEEIVI
jgi:hypothetical protein